MLDFESGLTLMQPLLLQAILIYESKHKLNGSVKHLRLIMLHLVTLIWARDRENLANNLFIYVILKVNLFLVVILFNKC